MKGKGKVDVYVVSIKTLKLKKKIFGAIDNIDKLVKQNSDNNVMSALSISELVT